MALPWDLVWGTGPCPVVWNEKQAILGSGLLAWSGPTPSALPYTILPLPKPEVLVLRDLLSPLAICFIVKTPSPFMKPSCYPKNRAF